LLKTWCNCLTCNIKSSPGWQKIHTFFSPKPGHSRSDS
jgi:hypothetical protein